MIQASLMKLCILLTIFPITIGDSNHNQWTVRLHYESSSNAVVCGGVLISPKHILTAKHCVIDALTQGTPLTHIEFTNVDHLKGQPFRITYVHDHYDLDLSILVLEQPVEIQPIQLSKSKKLDGSKVEFHGFGQGVYKEVKLTLESRQDCNTEVAEYFQTEYNELFDHLCSRGHIVPGDSGGPLMKRTNKKQWKLVGIASFAIKKEFEDLPAPHPDWYKKEEIIGYFVNLRFAMTWIQNIIENKFG